MLETSEACYYCWCLSYLIWWVLEHSSDQIIMFYQASVCCSKGNKSHSVSLLVHHSDFSEIVLYRFICVLSESGNMTWCYIISMYFHTPATKAHNSRFLHKHETPLWRIGRIQWTSNTTENGNILLPSFIPMILLKYRKGWYLKRLPSPW